MLAIIGGYALAVAVPVDVASGNLAGAGWVLVEPTPFYRPRRNGDKVTERKTLAADPADVTTTRGSALRRAALIGYQWMLLIFLLAGVTQIFLAGLGVFRLQGHGLVAGGDTAFAPHRALGFTMGGIALLILVLAAIARPGARAIALSAVLVLLTSLMQSLLAGLGGNHAIYGGLHALDGLLILGIAGYLCLRTREPRP